MEKPLSVAQLLGSTIREMRLRKKLSQQQLADLAGLERTFVNGVERRHHDVTVMTLVRLAVAP